MAKPKKWDFEGWATRYGIKCADGETIAHGAFIGMDGVTVPLVDDHARGYEAYNDAIIGRAYLEHRDEGVYTFITFNPVYEKARIRKDQVEHGDIQKLSIKANDLFRKAGAIIKGVIRDLSIVSAGANPGAYIQQAQLVHRDGWVEDIDDAAYISCNDDVSSGIEHSVDDGEDPGEELNIGEVYGAMTDDQKSTALFIAAAILESAKDPAIEQGDPEGENIEGAEVTLPKLNVLPAEDPDEDPDEDPEDDPEDDPDEDPDEDPEDDPEDDPIPEIKHSNYNGGRNSMKANEFNSDGSRNENYIAASIDVKAFMETVSQGNTLAQACIEHGITNVTDLYDQATLVNPEPLIANSPQGWVKSVLGGCKKVPFTKIKSLWTDFTSLGDEAELARRAKGYPVLGEVKTEENLTILNRTTEPGWIYKMQKLDRDTLYQISSFNFLQWLHGEMGMMLNQELARAILIGDGRLVNDAYKIKEDRIRPISKETGVWTIQENLAANVSPDAMLDDLIELRSTYQGSGTPSMFTSPQQVGKWLKSKDATGRRIYKDVSEIAGLLRVKEIVEVAQINTAVNTTGKLIRSIMVDLNDYALSLPTGDAALKDSKFDINVNKEIYLLEWLAGGALITPFSAVVLTQDAPGA